MVIEVISKGRPCAGVAHPNQIPALRKNSTRRTSQVPCGRTSCLQLGIPPWIVLWVEWYACLGGRGFGAKQDHAKGWVEGDGHRLALRTHGNLAARCWCARGWRGDRATSVERVRECEAERACRTAQDEQGGSMESALEEGADRLIRHGIRVASRGER
eukprot:scaffold43037_cov28-Tisochrysis_lutea.AAC.2